MDMRIANFLCLQICGISFQNFGFENIYHVCIKLCREYKFFHIAFQKFDFINMFFQICV